MAEKYKNKYRIQSNRKPGWDYASNGHYFITLMVQHRHKVLGHVENCNMIFNPWGEIVLAEWKKSFEMRAELFCDIFVIMPDHLHAILTIENNANDDNNTGDDSTNHSTNHSTNRATTGTTHAETHGRAFLSLPDNPQPWERKPKSISSFMAGFKSATNTAIDNAIDAGIDLFPHLGKFNRNNHFWQPNYHDHIIRDRQSFERISKYIADNPAKWNNGKIRKNA